MQATNSTAMETVTVNDNSLTDSEKVSKSEVPESTGTTSDQSYGSEQSGFGTQLPKLRLVAIEKLLGTPYPLQTQVIKDSRQQRKKSTQMSLRKRVAMAKTPTATIVLTSSDSDSDCIPLTSIAKKQTETNNNTGTDNSSIFERRVCKVTLTKMDYKKILRHEKLSEICDIDGGTILIAKRKLREQEAAPSSPVHSKLRSRVSYD